MQNKLTYYSILCIFILQFQSFSNAQDTLFLENESILNLSEKVVIKKNPEGKFSIRDIASSANSSIFSHNNKDIIVISPDEKENLIKFIVQNIAQRQKTFYIELQNAQLFDVQFFTYQNGLIVSNLAQGTDFPNNKQLIRSRFITNPIVLESKESLVCFIKISNNTQLTKIPITIYDEGTFISNILKDSIINGIFYGILLTLIIATFALLIMRINTKIIFFYLLYILFSTIYFINIDGFIHQYLNINSTLINKNFSFLIPYLIFISLNLLTINTFTKICNDKKRLCVAPIGLVIIGLILFFIQLFIEPNYTIATFLFTSYSLIVGLAMFIYIIRSLKAYKTIGRFYLFAFFFLFVLFLMFGLHYSKLEYCYTRLEFLIKVFSSIHFAIILFVIIRQIGNYHFQIYKDSEQNQIKLAKLREHMNIELENIVRERTKRLQETNRKLNSLITHNNNITDELHKQREEVDLKNNELEHAFKKSSAQHIKLQKAMMINVEQQKKLASSLEIIQEKNKKLEHQNEEILSQRDKIREQNTLLEERTRNITDSIVYAERIQNSFFPPESKIKALFNNVFIYFRPKDILSGDIYWVDSIIKDNKELQLITAIDCTGHGVPGALMSIIARDAINEAIHHRGLTDSGSIVNCINDIVIHTLNKQGNINHIKDGMDLSMVIIDYETYTLQFTGAKNPLYLIRNNELLITKGSIHSVGTVEYANEPVEFPTYLIPFQQNDIIYLFSDGYADQFGGKNGNKYRYKRFKELLMNIKDLPMTDQYYKLDEEFVNWKKNWEQVDDVLIIGVKL